MGNMPKDKIETVVIGNLVEVIPSEFVKGSKITSVIIPNSVTTIGASAFSSCSGLTSVTIPNSVTEIGSSAFSGCSGLTQVHIMDIAVWCAVSFGSNNANPLYYAHHLFLNNTEITNLIIPNSVTSIGNSAFSGCSGLTSVTIPNAVASIGSWAFYNCSGLISVTIPNSVTEIGNYAFSSCSGLTDIYTHIEDPASVTLGSSVFYNVPKTSCILHVPAGTISAYQAADQWKDFTNIVEMEPPTVLATSIELDQSAVSLGEGMTLQLNATVQPEDATDKSLTWTSSNEAIATVDNNGLVTAIAPGTATITAATNDGSNLTASCSVTVETAVPNQLQVEDYTMLRGNSLTLPVQLINEANNLTALQADIHLPEGIAIEMDGDDYVIDLVSERVAGDHSVSSNLLSSNGAVRVLIASPTKKLFKGNSGDLFTISLLTNDDLNAGDYVVTIDNIILSDNTAATYHVPAVSSTITVLDVEMGDANGDGEINVGDYVTTAGYILEENPQPFVFTAADIDDNGSIDVGDLVGVATIILSTESPAGMPAHVAAANGTANLNAICQRTSDGRYLVAIDMSNDIPVTAMQMDLTLPDGLKLIDASLTNRASASHAIDFNRLQNGDWRVLAASASNKSFRGNEDTVLTLELEGDGEGLCTMSNIMLAQPNSSRIAHDNLTFEVGTTTGVNDVYGKVRIYAEGGTLIIESPHVTVAQLVMPNGMSQQLNVSAGRNVYRLGNAGYIFVKVDNEVAKFRF